MATTTPNYGWDVPTSTDYVKDGATAIEILGDDIDATLYSVTGGKGVGLQLLNNTSFTTQSAVNFTNVFSSTYTFYKVIATITGSTTLTVNMRFRENTTDKTTGYFGASGVAAYGGQFVLGDAFNNASQVNLRAVTPTNGGSISFDLMRTATNAEMSGTLVDVPNGQGVFFGYNNIALTNFTGFSLIASTGTISGNVKIYGYKESI
jgi:hypothetical protein